MGGICIKNDLYYLVQKQAKQEYIPTTRKTKNPVTSFLDDSTQKELTTNA